MIEQVDSFWLSKNPLLRRIRRWVSIYPALYIPLRRKRRPDTVVTAASHLVIEGFPRSGNTWTEALIREAGSDALNLAHHAHAAAHVKRALQLSVPSMIIFRDPDDAVASLLALYENQLDADGAFREYVRFYGAVWPLRGGDVRFYSFEDVTQRKDEVIANLAAAFDLPLGPGPVDETAVFARMDEKALQLKRRNTDLSKSRPDIDLELGEDRKAYAQNAIKAQKAAKSRAQARKVFAELQSDLGAGS